MRVACYPLNARMVCCDYTSFEIPAAVPMQRGGTVRKEKGRRNVKSGCHVLILGRSNDKCIVKKAENTVRKEQGKIKGVKENIREGN